MNPVPKPPRTPRKARKPLPPSSHPIPRTAKPKALNRKRKASEFARTYHSVERVEFVKSRGCLYCDLLTPRATKTPPEMVQNAHVGKVGAGGSRKANYDQIVPLCARCHRRYDERLSPMDDERLRSWVQGAMADVERAWRRASGRDGE